METLTLVLFIIGFVLLISGAELLVRGASVLAVAVGISPLVVGLTVVAFGTSAPELAVTIQSSYADQADLAVGNIVGSNISNILLVLGLAALFGNLLVPKQLVKLELPLLVVISTLTWLMARDGTISSLDGMVLVVIGVGYVIYTVQNSRKVVKAEQAAVDDDLEMERVRVRDLAQIFRQVGLIAVGLGMLVLGSRWLIDGAVAVALLLGVNQLVIGLTIVAVGTSLPEIATSIVAVIRDKRDIAVGNAVGSNIFNLLIVLGLGCVISPGGIDVSVSAQIFDIPVMMFVAFISLPVFYTNYRIDRIEGLIFAAYYVAYTTYLFLAATGSTFLPVMSNIMLWGVLPVTLLTIAVRFWRYYFQSRTGRAAFVQAPPSQN
ncbi:MAG TPA: calcium/sodium antiporter [Anaerolineae bacterium]|nr:calcium/sodium antiporter [Anaerolineae bacterium]HMR63699.1 calcium/sodium antiporter [Anaerolineae bacterium]